MKHTPGPWRIEGLGGPQPLIFATTPRWKDRTWICTTTDDDAHLIVAAPDLYKSLRDILSYYNSAPVTIQDQALAALRKAEGAE